MFMSNLREVFSEGRIWYRSALAALTVIVVLILVLMFLWDKEPDLFDVRQTALNRAGGDEAALVTGYITTATLLEVVNTMLNKRGGYLTNDVLPPGLFMDNVPNWEFGVIVQVRDLSQALRNDISRSQTQSTEDKDLLVADPQFHFDSDSWLFPATESEYEKGAKALSGYLLRLTNTDKQSAQFYARADNLREWLSRVEKRLGSLSQRLSASVGQERINTDLGGDAEAALSTPMPREMDIKTPWFEIDDVFYEARGSTWALIHFMHAIEHDFRGVLQKKNALVSVRQIIRELEGTQDTLWSPVIMNGTGFGLVANHSLVMASYISRANSAVIDLRNLLEQG
jgi:hypothetical protein